MVEGVNPDTHDGKVSWEQDQARAFGDTIRTLRRRAGLSQEALAHRVGISKNHVQLLEAGRGSASASGPPSNPRMNTVYGFAEALGVTPQELLPEQTATPRHGQRAQT